MDIPIVETRMPSELRLYDVVVNGYATRMRLHDADAKRLGASPVDAQPDAQPDAAAEPTDAPVRKARARTPNRARTADDNK